MGADEAPEKGTDLTTLPGSGRAKNETMKIELDLQSPYTPDGIPREDLPTGEVLGWDGNEWCNGFLERIAPDKVVLLDETKEYIFLHNVKRFAPLPEKIEE